MAALPVVGSAALVVVVIRLLVGWPREGPAAG